MRAPFEIERGDEFMSLVYALNAEADTGDPVVAGVARTELEQILVRARIDISVPSEPEPAVEPAPLRMAQSPAPVRPTVVPLPVRVERPAALAVAPASTFSRTAMVDELTGIGGPLALRRDLMLENSFPWPGGPRYQLVTIDLHPVAEVRAARGPDVADRLFRTLLDAVRVSLGPSDAIYRSGQDEITLLLRGPNGTGADQARVALESALRRALAERGLPRIRLATEEADSRGPLAAPEATAV
jgi:GGDEF domain-containing protein